jgi:putative nucleotidyltransferase with HDIG domain
MAPARILLVDDDPYVGTVFSGLLQNAGYLPIIARDGGEAIRHLSDGQPFDVVLLDLMLKGENGMVVLETSRELRPEIPVVMVTAVDDLGLAISAMKKGAYDYLLKPFDSQQLLTIVARAIEHRELDRKVTLNRQNLEQLIEARTQMLCRAMEDLERSYDITLEALGNALDLKDAETEGHSKRVTAYSIVLARSMQIDPADIKIIARGAFLHDIGKMAIPDAILTKPSRLNAEEQAIMREHCVLGYAMLRKIPFLEKAAEIVLSHQEHYDGSGYPRGLTGDDIILGARIFSIADAMDAITSDRPYRRAKTFAAARKEIERCSGTQFDPSIVAVFKSLPDRIWEELRAEIDQPKGLASLSLSESLRNR